MKKEKEAREEEEYSLVRDTYRLCLKRNRDATIQEQKNKKGKNKKRKKVKTKQRQPQSWEGNRRKKAKCLEKLVEKGGSKKKF